MPLADYPYLLASLLLFVAFAVGAALVPGQRRAMLVSASLSAPYAFSSVLFVPRYWQPRRIACLGAGPEDLLFSFAGGGLIWLLATRLVSPEPTVSLEPAHVVRRYLTLSSTFFALVLACIYLLGAEAMTGVLVSGAVHFVVLIVLRPDLARFAVLGGMAYCIAYTLFTAFVFVLWPQFRDQWNWDNLTGLTVLAVPIEESIWALVFASCWTLGMGYAFDALLPHRAGNPAETGAP